MTDDKTEPTKPVVQPVPEKFPGGHRFPEDLLSRWISIPGDAPLMIGPLTRNDLDNLLFSIGNIARGIGELQNALISLSRGNTAEAETFLSNSWGSINDGEARNRMFFEAIMRAAMPNPGDDNAAK
ncbi:MAG: hypothetical protein J0G33_02820 [Afipia felis]|nr:hypothetical protein [Afipia felis]